MAREIGIAGDDEAKHQDDMRTSRLLAVGTACPELFVTQAEAYAFYRQHDLMPSGQRRLYERLLRHSPIRGRYFGMADTKEALATDPDVLHARFATYGRQMSAAACRDALKRAGAAAADVGGVVVNTCTGYLCPGLTSYLAEDLGLPTDVRALDIMGMGCGSAIPNLECGCGLLGRTRDRPVLCVSVEICSATHFVDDDPGLTVSNCIFGDGAAAAVLSGVGGKGAVLMDFEHGLFPEYREALRYTQENGRLRNRLTRRVPAIGAACVEEVVGRLLKRNGLSPTNIAWWAVHAGGTAVLDEIAERIGIPRIKLAASDHVFATRGNMSSPTVLFVLRELLDRGEAEGMGVLLAFGAGFSAFAALARAEGPP